MAPKKKGKKAAPAGKKKEDDETPALRTKGTGSKPAAKGSPKASELEHLPRLAGHTAMQHVQQESLEQAALCVQQHARAAYSARLVRRRVAEMKAMKRAAHRAWVENLKTERKKEERRRKAEREAQQRKEEERRLKAKFLEAAYDNDLKTVQACITAGISPDFQKDGENSPLSEAAVGGALQCVEFLIGKFADVNQRGQYGRTPLWRAAFSGHADVIKVLLKNGADPRVEAQGEAPVLNASGDAKAVLQGWDVAETERLLPLYEQRREAVRRADADLQTKRVRVLETEVARAEKSDEAAQKVLCKARCSLEQRITEYDVCVRDGKDELQDTALSYVKDAERELEAAKEKADQAREALIAAKAALRGAGDGSATTQKPGIHIDYDEVIETLWKDVHRRIAKSEKWPFVIDPTLKTQTFLRYRDIVYVNVLAARDMEPERLRMAILGALRYGKPLVVDMMDVDMVKEMRQRFAAVAPQCFEWLLAPRHLRDGGYRALVKPSDPDAYQGPWDEETMAPYRVIFLTSYGDPNEEFLTLTYPIWITPDLDVDEDED
eukprot:EG_transcript_6409